MKPLPFVLLLSLSSLTFLSSCKKDPCKDVTCLNGATCSDGDCICAAGYEGTDCGVEQRAKFLGIYSGNFSCTGIAPFQLTLTINTSSSSVSNVVMSDGADTWTGTVSGSSVTVPNQQISGGVNISGSGQIVGNVLTLSLTLSGTSCTYTGTKQ